MKEMKGKKSYIKYLLIGLLMGLFILSIYIFTRGEKDPVIDSKFILEESIYPETVDYPKDMDKYKSLGDYDYTAYERDLKAWEENRELSKGAKKGYDLALKDFHIRTYPMVLKGDGKKNMVYSPTNLYMGLSMLGEITGTKTQGEVLNLLGLSNPKELREIAEDIFLTNHRDDGLVTSILRNSLWLREGEEYKKESLSILKDKYYASTYWGDMGDLKYTEQMRAWINEGTGNLLKEQVSNLEFDPSTVISLISTIYYDNTWLDEFDESLTENMDFHGISEIYNVPFMKERSLNWVLEDEDYAITSKDLRDGKMYFILPKEGLSVFDILDGDSLKSFLKSPGFEGGKKYMVNLEVPKFDLSSDLDMIKILKNLGLKRVFDADLSDFSNLSENKRGLYVSTINHGARTRVDERGVLASAYTYIEVVESAGEIVEEEYFFTLNRPFIFVIYGQGTEGNSNIGDPLFMGLVTRP